MSYNVQKVLLKKRLRKYTWFSEKAYKYIHNRFRWFMITHHYYDYQNKNFIITNVSYDSFYSSCLFINFVIGVNEYLYRCDLKYLDL